MPEFRSPEAIGSQTFLQPVAPAWLGCLCIQVEVGDNASQLAALRALEPRVADAMRLWLAGHPGTAPEHFMAALEAGVVSAVDMGLMPRSEEDEVVHAGRQIAKLLRQRPVFAAGLGFSGTVSVAVAGVVAAAQGVALAAKSSG